MRERGGGEVGCPCAQLPTISGHVQTEIPDNPEHTVKHAREGGGVVITYK